MNVKENFVKNLQRQSKEKLQKLKEEKKNRMHNKVLQLICFCSLGFQKEVHQFHLLFIFLLPLRVIFRCLHLKKNLNPFF
jgi:uncharacterized membrane protein YqhA